ncbi:MAG: Na+/H+ antiporter NhaC family protein [Oscillospiraceae bacterium]
MSTEKKAKAIREPTKLEAIIAISFLFLSIIIGSVIFKLKMEVFFILSAFVAGYIGIRCGYKWPDMQKAYVREISKTTPLFLILLGIGFVIGTWVYSGTVPVMIGWLASLLSPKYVLVLSFVFCAAVALIIGTSSATLGTIGIIMLGVSTIQGIPAPIAASAVICGSYIGQVLSPLADMVNYNSALTGNTPIQGIRLVLPSELVGVAVAVGFYLIYGFSVGGGGNAESVRVLIDTVFTYFGSSVIVLLPVVVLFALLLFKVDTAPTLFTSGFVAILVGKFYQGFSLKNGFLAGYSGFNTKMLNVPEGTELLKEFTTVITRGGFTSMTSFLITIILIMSFIGILSEIGVIKVMSRMLLGNVKKAGNLILLSSFVTFLMTAATGSITATPALTNQMFADTYERVGLSRRNLVTTNQICCNLAALMIPWLGTSVYTAGIIGLGTLEWAPYLFICWVPIIMNIIFGYLGIGLIKVEPKEAVNNI